MSLVWYEKDADESDNIIFQRRTFEKDGSTDHLHHFHCGVEMVFVINGDCEVFVDNEKFILHSGQVCYVDAVRTHKFCYKKGNECYVVVLSPGYMNSSNALSTKSFPTVNEYNEGFGVIREFLDFSYKNWIDSSVSFKQGFADLLVGLMRRYYTSVDKKDHRKNDKVLFEAVKYINENCRSNIEIKDLAAKFGYTENYFSTILKRFVGMSFRDYINRCRILEYIRIRKENPNVSLSCAAELCGFGSVKSFYRAKKKFEKEEVEKGL